MPYIKYVKSVGAVVLNKDNRMLIMFQKENRYWEFPKGKVEPGEEENEQNTLSREIEEETGITDLKIIPGFRYRLRYQFTLHGQIIRKENIFYLAVAQNDKIKISDEHLDYKWVSLLAVNRYLKHKNQRILIYQLREFLKNHPLPNESKMASS
ncbi:MAG: NUDIX domain-containing protein [Patescibacteria group bacterium]|jgi:8-oxo-dGTP pyrophosphatase MutT (NUDIX family)